MFRKFYNTLNQWESDHVQEPLMVIGVRQVGKTWLIREFCEAAYKDYFYLNLEESPEYLSAFEGSLAPEVVLRNLSILAGRPLTSSTALVFDEIQVSERAITSLKYFCEAKEDYRVITAGSLLGVKINRFSSSFPVGKVRIARMYPMDFKEFLTACGEELLRDAVSDAFRAMQPLPEAIHEKAMRLFADYLIVGGMPAAVADYAACGKSITLFRRQIHQELKLAYLADMTKYVTSPMETVKIAESYQSVPRQLARENPKFKYSTVRSNANKRDFASAVDWLCASGMVIKVCSLDLPAAPLAGYKNDSVFKIYLSDCGMLSSLAGLQPRDLAIDTANIYKGAVIENYVMQQFAPHIEEMFYFKPSDSMEIDLIYDSGTAVIPIEIKSGRHKRSTSLKNYINRFSPSTAIRFSALNFGKSECLWSVPLYAVFCLFET